MPADPERSTSSTSPTASRSSTSAAPYIPRLPRFGLGPPQHPVHAHAAVQHKLAHGSQPPAARVGASTAGRLVMIVQVNAW